MSYQWNKAFKSAAPADWEASASLVKLDSEIVAKCDVNFHVAMQQCVPSHPGSS